MRELPTLLALLLTSACSSGAPCDSGGRGCPCIESRCDEGLACDADRLCRAPHTASLPAVAREARSCEVLLEDGTARVVTVRYGDSVEGTHVRQAPRTALAFFAKQDAPMDAAEVQIELLGEGSLNIARNECFDAQGRPLAAGARR